MKQLSLTPLPKPVKTVVSVPGSKSITNRALILASLCKNPVQIEHPLYSDDTEALISCLQTLGIKILQEKNRITVVGSIFDVKRKVYHLDAHLSGTTMRFLLAFCCLVPGEKILTGEEGLCKRPVKDLVDTLKQLGAQITYLEQEGFPPVRIKQSVILNGSRNLPKQITINGSTSSQFISAVLMIAPLIKNIAINIKGKRVSESYVKLTKQIMQQFGVQVVEKNNIFKTIGTYSKKDFIVEGDFSAAAYFAAIAALTKSTITLQNINPDSIQGDKEFFGILERMGNTVISSKNDKSHKSCVTIIGKCIKSISVNMKNCPDQIQTLAVLAAFAKGPTKISGIATLKVKETNRLMAITTELAKMGIKIEIKNDKLIVFGGTPHAATINTYRDHRMAMSFAVAGAKLPGMIINNPEVVAKTFPDFWKVVKKIGIGTCERRNDSRKIVLTGFMGAGKSSIAPLLAKKLNFDAIEMDDLVIKKSKKKSIKEIFDTQSEEKFRKLEHKIAKTLINKKNIVVSTGGGVIMNNTINILKENATIIFLSTEFVTIEKRLSDTTGRPLWKNKKQTRALFDLRKPIYKQHADIIVSTDGKSLEKITEEIIERITNV
jgi:3-phosphoshikimate 1-carboxyvinyltransferase